MNHPIDPDPETYREEDSTRLKLLDTLIDKIIQRMNDNSCQPKIRDALKAIQLKEKLSEAKSVGVFQTSEVERSETHRAEQFFWQEIEAIRNDELPKLYPETEPLDLESQITNTIAGLKYLITNGILPVKIITDLKTQNSGTFNQNRSKEIRLTYHRLGRLLSTTGFRKAKTPSGCSAIIWDHQLLQDESYLKIHFLAMKKMKNSHPHVPHVPQVRPVGQKPQAPFRYGLHKGENTRRLLRHHLGRPTSFMVSLRTIYAEFRSTCGEFRSILRTPIRTYIILCLRTVWR